MQIPKTPVNARRNRARLYIAMAERHRDNGDDAKLVAALVRAAWREHVRADATVTESRGPLSSEPAKPKLRTLRSAS